MKKIPTERKNSIQARRSHQIRGGAAGAKSPKSLAKVGASSELQKTKDVADHWAQAMAILASASGVKDTHLAAHIVDQVHRTLSSWSSGDALEAFKVAVGMMHEVKPEGVMEAMLATQMIGVNNAALSALERAASLIKSSKDRDAATRASARLMRLFMEQLEAMAKLKGKSGQQKIIVEHVDVHSGGQAIVGAVSTNPRREGEGGHEETRKRTP